MPREKVISMLTDFSKQRPQVWPGLWEGAYEVYSVGETSADVKEGSKLPGMIVWAKEHYDWSDPNAVRWTAVESNFCAAGSHVAVTLHPREGGGTRLHVEWERTGTTVPGKLMVGMIKLSNGRPVAASIKKALAKLER